VAGIDAKLERADLRHVFGLTPNQVRAHHSQKHLSRAQPRASIDRADEAEEQHEVALVLDARKLRYKAIQLLITAERSGDLTNALRGIREARETLLAEARLSGQLDPPNINVSVENEAPSVVVILPSNGRESPEIIGNASDFPAIEGSI
jgi:hypothetical protein